MRAFFAFCALVAAGLPLCAHAGTVEGRVFDARGRAAGGVELVLGTSRTVTLDDGSYRLDDVAAGPQVLRAGSQGVSVDVPQQGAVRRNLFLLSASARTRVTGEPVAADSARVLAASVQAAAVLLAEADAMPARHVADSEG